MHISEAENFERERERERPLGLGEPSHVAIARQGEERPGGEITGDTPEQ